MDQQFLSWISETINSKFLLFQDKRPREEDEKIALKVYQIVFDEMGDFIYTNLSQDKQAAFKERFEELAKKNPQDEQGKMDLGQEMIGIYDTHLEIIENGNEKLKEHLSKFIDLMVEESLKNLKK